VAAFGLLRLSWIETHVLLPLTHTQGTLAGRLFGAPAAPVDVTLACSGAEALAVCFGATLAYPTTWRMRLAGAGGGAALILALNTLRIGSLGRAAASRDWFDTLHLYVWPAVLTLAIVGYVFVWMHRADGQRMPFDRERGSGFAPAAWRPARPRRLLVLTFALLLLFLVASPLYWSSPAVFALAGLVARASAAILDFVGVSAYAAANVLRTSHGGFLVTQECVVTPLIPIYLAIVLTYAPTWRHALLGVVATLPLFTALAILRLLAIALPAAAGPLFFVHAFHQLLVALLIVCLVAFWRHGGKAAPGHALAGLVAGVLFILLIGPFYTRVVMYPSGTPLHDPQGAIALLPAFQVGLYLALWIAGFMALAWPRVIAGIAALGLTQTAGLLMLHAVGSHAGWTWFVPGIRGWAVAAPVLILAAVTAGVRTPR
jgi:exosortase/archaeosortase family protein